MIQQTFWAGEGGWVGMMRSGDGYVCEPKKLYASAFRESTLEQTGEKSPVTANS